MLPDVMENYKRRLKDFGVAFESDINECSALITSKVARTQKLLIAMAKGIPILSTRFLDAIIENKAVPAEIDTYILRDLINERKYRFDMASTILNAQKGPLLTGIVFYLTPQTFPDNQTLKGELCGESLFIFDFVILIYLQILYYPLVELFIKAHQNQNVILL